MKAPEYVERIEALEASQTAQDAAIEAAADAAGSAQATAAGKVATVNGLAPDAAGNVDVGGMPLGAAFPYTGRDVPAGTLRADGATYTGMQASFPDFYAWVKQSGLAVPMADYALVEGSCGRYGLDESTGTVRMPALAAGVFGAGAASEYGQAVQAGLPNITGRTGGIGWTNAGNAAGAFYEDGAVTLPSAGEPVNGKKVWFDASRSSSVYGRSDTVTPSHVKYPWVIVVYNAAAPASVAEAGEFVGLLDGKVGLNLENVTAEGRERVVGWGMPDYTAGVSISTGVTVTASVDSIFYGDSVQTSGEAYIVVSLYNGANSLVRTMRNRHAVASTNGHASVSIFVPKGYKIKVSGYAGTLDTVLYPLKGAV